MQHRESGSWEFVEESEVAQRYQSGEYGIPEGQEFDLVGESGKEYKVQTEDLDNALGSGFFRLKSPAERGMATLKEELVPGGALGNVLTAGTRAADIATGGMAFKLMEKLHPDTDPDVLREIYHPRS